MRVIIAAAGTGGHINPGIAIANEIKMNEPDSEIVFIGTTRGIENELVPKANYRLKTINAFGIPRKISLENMKKFYRTIKSVSEAEKIIKEFKPDVVIGTGGYITLAVGRAAIKQNVSLVIHESNAFPGMAVKLLSKKASRVFVGFEDTKTRLKNKNNIIVTGTPTSVKPRNVSNEEKKKLKLSLGLNQDKPLVLFFGGSQGARSINNTLQDLLKEKKNDIYQIMWAVGINQYDDVKLDLEQFGISVNNVKNAKIVPYIYNMHVVMNASDLVVCRSGAMTITEVSILGKPAIFIPYPYATENHQEFNARVLESRDAAKIILDKDLNSDILDKTIRSIINDKNKLQQMSNNAKKIARFDVEKKIYREIKEILK